MSSSCCGACGGQDTKAKEGQKQELPKDKEVTEQVEDKKKKNED